MSEQYVNLSEALESMDTHISIDGNNTQLTITELVKRAHSTALSKGWWETDRNPYEMVALMHSELSEAVEELRSGADPTDVYLSCLDSHPAKPEGFFVELADCVIRIADIAGRYGVDLEKIIKDKMEYNKTRPYRHGGKTA